MVTAHASSRSLKVLSVCEQIQSCLTLEQVRRVFYDNLEIISHIKTYASVIADPERGDLLEPHFKANLFHYHGEFY